MKKIINDPMNFVKESLEGIIYAYPDFLKFSSDKKGIMRTEPPAKGKVTIVTGGGAGHLPVFLGYVGRGLADGAAVGNVFTSPSADAIVNVAKEVHGDGGILFLYGHYFGDTMNFDLAAEILEEEEDLPVKTVRVSDDIASAPRDTWEKRRGVAGIFFAYKIAGACADKLLPLEKVKGITEKAVANIATMGVAISSCTIPESGKPTFEIADDEMEVGMGIHGEPGIRRTKLKTADEITSEIIDYLIEDLKIKSGDEVSLLVNGSGTTPPEELYIVNRAAHLLLSSKNIKIYKTFVGEYATSLDMGGISLSILKLDNELKEYLDAPYYSPFL
ncbi:dihydroxyacetone kinase subunit DhaK [Metabacillus arenae]|uniref:Dihydroxyacetone kinase subunit DhaK n=1 Tax=Metabacillus arenae TaxID=2771434 RepID=A0A926NKS5_9BACI|nr:dihydroxyacetone kinase subunit DhaK [Metabacillus arenae]MBD1382423.1 dihydroxyacetone kinase subunit DhaK [Metabacillus arenae]